MNYRRKLEVQAIQLNQDTVISIPGYGNPITKKLAKDSWIVFENGETFYYDDKKFRELYESAVKKIDVDFDFSKVNPGLQPPLTYGPLRLINNPMPNPLEITCGKYNHSILGNPNEVGDLGETVQRNTISGE